MRVIERLARPQPSSSNVVPSVAGILLALAALVLLLACMNVANILLVRATMRQREMAIRAAMGADRWRLIRQLLTESLLLSLFGGVAGRLSVSGPTARSSCFRLARIPVHLSFGFDWRVFAYAIAAAHGTVVGLWPAWRAARADVNSVLHGGRSDAAGAGSHRVRSVLVVAQVAGSLVLLIVAGLFVRSLLRAQQTYMGFDPNHVLKLCSTRRKWIRRRPHQVFYHDLEAKVRVLPGVERESRVSCSDGIANDATLITSKDNRRHSRQQPPAVVNNRVDEHYFDTMRVPLLRGRAFQQNDDDKASLVAIVNESMALAFWPNEDPLGNASA